jgi:hypothetical protein
MRTPARAEAAAVLMKAFAISRAVSSASYCLDEIVVATSLAACGVLALASTAFDGTDFVFGGAPTFFFTAMEATTPLFVLASAPADKPPPPPPLLLGGMALSVCGAFLLGIFG